VESNKVRATYNKALLLDQRRTLLQDWADYLSAVEDSGAVQSVWAGAAFPFLGRAVVP
jgi:hypothetical protein